MYTCRHGRSSPFATFEGKREKNRSRGKRETERIKDIYKREIRMESKKRYNRKKYTVETKTDRVRQTEVD